MARAVRWLTLVPILFLAFWTQNSEALCVGGYENITLPLSSIENLRLDAGEDDLEFFSDEGCPRVYSTSPLCPTCIIVLIVQPERTYICCGNGDVHVSLLDGSGVELAREYGDNFPVVTASTTPSLILKVTTIGVYQTYLQAFAINATKSYCAGVQDINITTPGETGAFRGSEPSTSLPDGFKLFASSYRFQGNDCRWRFFATEGYLLSISLEGSMYLSDSVVVFDGESDEAPILGVFSGTNSLHILSTGPVITMRFQSGFSVGGGAYFTYVVTALPRVVDYCPASLTTQNITSVTRFSVPFSVQSYAQLSHHYPPGYECSFRFQAPLGYYLLGSLTSYQTPTSQNRNDIARLYDTDRLIGTLQLGERWQSSASMDFASTTPLLLLDIATANGSSSGIGFEITFDVLPLPNCGNDAQIAIAPGGRQRLPIPHASYPLVNITTLSCSFVASAQSPNATLIFYLRGPPCYNSWPRGVSLRLLEILTEASVPIEIEYLYTARCNDEPIPIYASTISTNVSWVQLPYISSTQGRYELPVLYVEEGPPLYVPCSGFTNITVGVNGSYYLQYQTSSPNQSLPLGISCKWVIRGVQAGALMSGNMTFSLRSVDRLSVYEYNQVTSSCGRLLASVSGRVSTPRALPTAFEAVLVELNVSSVPTGERIGGFEAYFTIPAPTRAPGYCKPRTNLTMPVPYTQCSAPNIYGGCQIQYPHLPVDYVHGCEWVVNTSMPAYWGITLSILKSNYDPSPCPRDATVQIYNGGSLVFDCADPRGFLVDFMIALPRGLLRVVYEPWKTGTHDDVFIFSIQTRPSAPSFCLSSSPFSQSSWFVQLSNPPTFAYLPNARCNQTLTSTRSGFLVVSVTVNLPPGDQLTIFDGNSTNAPRLAAFNESLNLRKTILSTGPSILVSFQAGNDTLARTNFGYRVDASIVERPKGCPALTSIRVSGTATISNIDAVQPGAYYWAMPPNLTCEWMIASNSPDSVLQVSPVLSQSPGLENIEIFDGNRTDQAPLLLSIGAFTDDNAFTVISTSPQIRIRYFSGPNPRLGGFWHLNVQVTPRFSTVDCGNRTLSMGDEVKIPSEYFYGRAINNGYGPNLRCFYEIFAPLGFSSYVTLNYDIQPDEDFITVWEGNSLIHRLTGRGERPLFGECHALRIAFTSSDAVIPLTTLRRRGFVLRSDFLSWGWLSLRCRAHVQIVTGFCTSDQQPDASCVVFNGFLALPNPNSYHPAPYCDTYTRCQPFPNLRVTYGLSFNRDCDSCNVSFPRLETAGPCLYLTSFGLSTFDFPNLTMAWAVTVVGDTPFQFPVTRFSSPKIQYVRTLSLSATSGNNFTFPFAKTLVDVSLTTCRNFILDISQSGLSRFQAIDLTGSVTLVLPPMRTFDEIYLSNLPFAELTFLRDVEYGASIGIYTMQNLRTLDLSALKRVSSILSISGAPSLTSLHVTNLSGSTLQIEDTRLKEVQLGSFSGYLDLADNNRLTNFHADGVTSLASFRVIRSPLAVLSLPNLRTLGTFELTRNILLERLNMCNVTSVGVVKVSTSPLLSCQDTIDVLNTSRTNFTMVPPACSTSRVGTFGCGMGRVYTVDTSGCGYFVRCIQAAINQVVSGHGSLVRIPQGTYANCSSPLNTFGKSFTLTGVSAATTVIDCSGSGRAMVIESGEGTQTAIQNITMMGGHADIGGCLLISGAAPRISGCEFRHCVALSGGGAVAIRNSAAPVFVNCSFIENTALNGAGGAIAVEQSSITLARAVFRDNVATGDGGALYVAGSSETTELDDVEFISNRAARGGGLFTDGPAVLDRCSFYMNQASDYGGALAAVPANPESAVWTNVSDSSFIGNAADGGGAIFGFSANLELRTVVLDGNYAGSDGGGGVWATCSRTARIFAQTQGPCAVSFVAVDTNWFNNSALAAEGGALKSQDVTSSITRASFTANRAARGAGIYASGSALRCVAVTMQDNRASDEGGALLCEPFIAPCVLSASALTGNYAGNAGGGIYFCTTTCPGAYANDTLTLQQIVSANDLSGNSVGALGFGGAVASDPSRMTWNLPSSIEAISGLPITDAAILVLVVDAFDQTVLTSSGLLIASMRITLENGDVVSEVVVDGTQTALVDRGQAAFPGLTLIAQNTTHLNTTYILTCTLSDISNVELATSITLLPCGVGQGRSSADGDFDCGACLAGSAGSGYPEYVCVGCPAGTFSSQAGSSACEPCPINTHAPLSGASACLLCPEGYHTDAPGAIACAPDPSAIVSGVLTGDALSATIGGLVGGLILCVVCIGFFVYRQARRRTLQKYYLDNDATLRAGVTETPLQKEVKRVILASSTTRIGGGLYSDVYKAKYEGEYIALKVIKGEMATDGTAQQEFRREAVALSRLEDRKHPGIVQLKFFLNFNPMCIGIAFCNGGSLKRAISMRIFPSVSDKVRIATEAASAFSTIHACDIVHLDIKTDNILLSSDNHVVVADFGIARVLGVGNEPDMPSEFQTSSILGQGDTTYRPTSQLQGSNVSIVTRSAAQDTAFTPQYVDPLRVVTDMNDDEAYLPKADVFSFAMLMWVIMAEEEPYAGQTSESVLNAIRARPDTRPRALPDAPPAYVDLMTRAWHRAPHLRPTMLELFEGLSKLGVELGIALARAYAAPDTRASSALSTRQSGHLVVGVPSRDIELSDLSTYKVDL